MNNRQRVIQILSKPSKHPAPSREELLAKERRLRKDGIKCEDLNNPTDQA